MSDSVGKITLDLEVTSDIAGQVKEVSSTIANTLKSSLSSSTNKVFDNIDKSMKSSLSQVNSNMKSMMSNVTSNLKNSLSTAFSTLKNIKIPTVKFNTVSAQNTGSSNVENRNVTRGPPVNMNAAEIDTTSRMLENVNLQIEQQKNKLQSLKNAYNEAFNIDKRNAIVTEINTTIRMMDVITGKVRFLEKNLKSLQEAYHLALNPAKKNKINEQILNTEGSIAKLRAQADKLGFKLNDLDSKLTLFDNGSSTEKNKLNEQIIKTEESILRLTGKSNKLTSKLNDLKAKFNSTSKESSKLSGIFNRINNSLKGLTSGLNSSSKSTKNFSNSLSNIMRQFFTWMIILPIIQRGIYAFAGYIFSSLNTNAQFVNSLNQIKTNLMVAFMPIYQAILPAINALMSALATVTQYIASFISAIFGKTYNQSFQAAQGLINAKDAMGAYGSATEKAGNSAEKAGQKAKKALGDLMGFDEINKLNMNDSSDTSSPSTSGTDGSGAPILTKPTLDTSVVDKQMSALLNKVKSIMSKIFEPFVNAWNKEGQNTINALKYALNGIWELIKAIGSSFLKVWTNGSGERILILLLQILQNIFNIVGDIANTFAKAWKENEIGTKIIQGVANVIENLLTLIKKVGDSFREAWGVIGEPLAKAFLKVIESTIGILENLSEKLIYVWDNGGSHLFNSLIKLGAKIIELASYIYTEFVAPFVNWFVNMIAPALAPLLDNLGKVFDKFTELIDWLLSDGKPVLDTIISLIGGAAGLAGAFKVAKKGIEIFNGIKSAAEILGKAFFNLNPKAILIKLAIAAIIAIGIYLITHWDEIKEKCKKVWNDVKEKFTTFKEWLKNVFATDWSKRFGGFGDILNGFLKSVSDIFKSVKQIFNGIINFITGIFTGNWRKAWNGIVNIFVGIMNGLRSVTRAPLNAVIGLINAAISGLNKISVDIPSWVPGKYSGKKFGLNIPKIPYLARGGLIDSPTLSVVGEQGKEAVLPLENNTGALDLIAEKLSSRMTGGSSGNSSIGDITIQIGNDTLAKILLSELKRIQRQTGQAIINV